MANTHGVADTMYEMQGLSKDLLPACIVSTTFPAVPAPPSLTLAAFGTKGYVIDGSTLVYVDQEAHAVTITGSDGNYWLALGQDTFTSVSSWTRTSGTHYLWRASATEPASVDGILCFCQLTVAGGAITVVTPLTKVTNQPMSKQNSNAVAITGGTATFTGQAQALQFHVLSDFDSTAFLTNRAAGGGRYAFQSTGTAPSALGGSLLMTGNVGINATPTNDRLTVRHNATDAALSTLPTVAGTTFPVVFKNSGGTTVGYISTTDTATTYSTTSDVRLKEALTPLQGGLDVTTALEPVAFRWRATGQRGVGFSAQAVQRVIPEAVSGSPEAPEPMGVDFAKLVPYLVSAIKDMAQQVEALTARLATLEGTA